MTMRKTLAYALVLGAALTVAPQLGSAVTPVIGTNNVNSVTTFDDAWATASTSAANSLTIHGSLWYNWFGGGTGAGSSDVTAITGAPARHGIVVYCNNNLGNPQVAGPITTWSTSSTYTLDKFCPSGQKGSASEHWSWAD